MADRSGGGAADVQTRPWFPFALIIAASLLAHIWCLGSQFFLDDPTAIRDNEEIREGHVFSGLKLSWTQLGYFIQYQLFGLSPVGVHAVNWLLHTAVACVLFAFGRDFTRGRTGENVPMFGALLFAVHPLASEIPNYARCQDLAWVTLFSLLASWSLLRFLQRGGWLKILWTLVAMAGATMSKGPGMFHAVMMVGAVGLACMMPEHWKHFRRRGLWLALLAVAAVVALWAAGLMPFIRRAIMLMEEPRFIGHAFTLARVFWEFAWRAVIPVSLSADHHIQETLIPAGSRIWDIPDRIAILAAVSMLALTTFSIFLAWRKKTRLMGVCLFLFTATILFRVLYFIPEFMPEYRIYPGMPWFCLGAALVLGAVWQRFFRGFSPSVPAVLLILVFALMSARRSFQWHDLDRLMADVLDQYPAQGRAIWELHRRDAHVGDWQKIIDRQRTEWPRVFKRFLEENRRLAPARELPTGHFALADVGCAAVYAEALAHVHGVAPALAELRRLEAYMKGLQIDPATNRIHWIHYHQSKLNVLEHAGRYREALDVIEGFGEEVFSKSKVRRIREKALEPSRID